MFKKIHEGLDLFNYYFQRHEASNNDSQREKLEADLKKEIKKLQKFRDQIKTWQGNDAIEAAVAAQKLQEHRRLVEEAMECYKDVEKTSKMKSYSNQSIMLAALDNNENQLTPEGAEAADFLREVQEELNDQNEKLDEEYEKLSQKKVRKNNMLAIEERKLELEGFKTRNEFHVDKIEGLLGFLTSGKIAPELIMAIQDDLNFYVESNQEPDFMDDETMYDELYREAKENHERNINVNETMEESFDLSLSNGHESHDTEATGHADGSILSSIKESPHSSASPAPEITPLTSQQSLESSKEKQHSTPKAKFTAQASKIENAASSSPAIITTLKPASTPSKPVGALKWSLAAAGNSKSSESPNGSKQASPERNDNNENSKKEEARESPALPSHDESNASAELLSLLTKNDEFSAHLEVLKNSKLNPTELSIFSDVNLLKAPVGVQDLVASFAASNKANESSKLLQKQAEYDPFTWSPIAKPYLFQGLYPSPTKFDQLTVRAPVFLGRLQNQWGRLKTLNYFEQYAQEIESLEIQRTSDSTPVVNEMTLVLFYGYYYGYLPLENVVAESLLSRLGWRPYGASESEPEKSGFKQLQFWFKPVSGDSMGAKDPASLEVGDFRVFDLVLWEIYFKQGFKFDPRLSRPCPAASLL